MQRHRLRSRIYYESGQQRKREKQKHIRSYPQATDWFPEEKARS